MPKVDVINQNKEKVEDLELSDDVFGARINLNVIYDTVKAHLASKRSGNANSKTRSEVRGSTRKVYKQKGTGNARHGSIRAPIYVGGGKAHGPKPRDFSYNPPKAVRKNALRSALSHKLKEGKLIVIDNFQLSEIKTKNLTKVLTTLEVNSSLIVDQIENVNLILSARNLPKHKVSTPGGLNVYDILRSDFLILSKDSISQIEKRCVA